MVLVVFNFCRILEAVVQFYQENIKEREKKPIQNAMNVIAALVLESTAPDSGKSTYKVVVFASGTKYNTHKVCTISYQNKADERYCWDVCGGHAEAICYRLAGVYFLHEISEACKNPNKSSIFFYNEGKHGYELVDTVKFHLCVSKSPCGFMTDNASHVMAWKHPFEEAPHVLSCSSKILIGSYLGIQSFVSCILVKPIYISSIVILHEVPSSCKSRLPDTADIEDKFDTLEEKVARLKLQPETIIPDIGLMEERLCILLDNVIPQDKKNEALVSELVREIMLIYETEQQALDFRQQLSQVLKTCEHTSDHLYEDIMKCCKKHLMATPDPGLKLEINKLMSHFALQNKLYAEVTASYDMHTRNLEFRQQLYELLRDYEPHHDRQHLLYKTVKRAYENSLTEKDSKDFMNTNFKERLVELLRECDKLNLCDKIMKTYDDFPMKSSYEVFVESLKLRIPEGHKHYNYAIETYLNTLQDIHYAKFKDDVQKLLKFNEKIYEDVIHSCGIVQSTAVDQTEDHFVSLVGQENCIKISHKMKDKPKNFQEIFKELFAELEGNFLTIYKKSICPLSEFNERICKLINLDNGQSESNEALRDNIFKCYEECQKPSFYFKFEEMIQNLFKQFCTKIAKKYFDTLDLKTLLQKQIPRNEKTDSVIEDLIQSFEVRWTEGKCEGRIKQTISCSQLFKKVLHAYNENHSTVLHVEVLKLVEWCVVKIKSKHNIKSDEFKAKEDKARKEIEEAITKTLLNPLQNHEFRQKIEELLEHFKPKFVNPQPPCDQSLQSLCTQSLQSYECILQSEPSKKFKDELQKLFRCCMQQDSYLFDRVVAAYNDIMNENIHNQPDLCASYVKPSVQIIEKTSQEMTKIFGKSIIVKPSSKAPCYFMIPDMNKSLVQLEVNERLLTVTNIWGNINKINLDLVKRNGKSNEAFLERFHCLECQVKKLSQSLSFQEALKTLQNEISQNLISKCVKYFTDHPLASSFSFTVQAHDSMVQMKEIQDQCAMWHNLNQMHKKYAIKTLITDIDCDWRRSLKLMSKYLSLQDK